MTAIDRVMAQTGAPQIFVQYPGAGVANHIQRSGDRIGRHRATAGHGFEQYQPEGVGPARENKHIGSVVEACQFDLVEHAGKPYLRVFLLQLGQQRPFARHPFGARQIELKKGLDVFFHRHAAHAQEHRWLGIMRARRARLEDVEVDTA